MSRPLWAVGWLGVMLSAAPAAAAEECNYLPEKTRPAWVGAGDGETDGHFQASGVAARQKDGFQSQMVLAKKAALDALTGMIETNVRSATKIEASKLERNGKVSVESAMSSVVETVASMTLQSVETEDMWLDRASCQLWVRLKISAKAVKDSQDRQVNGKLLDMLEEKLWMAEEGALDLDKRLAAQSEAAELLAVIDFSRVPGRTPVGVLKQKLQALDAQLGGRRQIRDSVDKARTAASRLLEKARLEFDPAAKTRQIAEARNGLLGVLANYPDAPGELLNRDDIYSQLSRLEIDNGSVCSARRYLTKVEDRSRPEVADLINRIGGQSCTEDELQALRWREVFEARKVGLVCFNVLDGGQAQPWDKYCETVAARIRKAGGVVSVQSSALTASTYRSLAGGGQDLAALRAAVPAFRDAALVMVGSATGKVNTRNDPDYPDRRQYQYEGKLQSYLVGGEAVIMKDVADGARSGWVDHSAQLMMDTLALKYAGRFESQLTRSLSAEGDSK